MNLLKRLKTFFLFKNSPKKNKEVTYGSKLEIYNADITYTNRYQNYPNIKTVKFLSNIIIEFSLNPDTLYCKEYFKFLNMLCIGNIRYTHIKDKGVMLLYISGSIYDYETLVCTNIESSNVLIETIVRLLETLPKDGFSRIISKNIIQEHRFAFDNNYNYDGNDIVKPYRDFNTAVKRFTPEKIVEIIEVDHLEYGMSKYIAIPAMRLSNIVFISNLDFNIRGYRFEVSKNLARKKDTQKVFVYCMRVDDFLTCIEDLIFYHNDSEVIYANLMNIIHDINLDKYFNIDKKTNGINIFNITPIDLTSIIDYTEDEEYDEGEESQGEQNYRYDNFYEGVDEILSEEDYKEAEAYAARINNQNN